VPGSPSARSGQSTLTDIVRYQGASGDMNPIHHDDEFARSAGFPAAIKRGDARRGAGWPAYCTEHLGEETVRRFRTPLFRGPSTAATG